MLTGSYNLNSGNQFSVGSSHGTVSFNKLTIRYDGSEWKIVGGSVSATIWIECSDGKVANASTSFKPKISVQ